MAEQEQKQIAIRKLYLKDFSFESPNTPNVFTATDWIKEEPSTNLNLRSAVTGSSGDVHEVVLTITVEAKHEDNTLFLVEVQQAGLFSISGYSPEEFEAIVGSFCPTTLFPFAREAIANVISKGGFPEFLLQPINFDALLAERKRQSQQDAAGSPGNGGEEVGH